ncbi:neprilysin-2-like [Microplitis mediator]|uniref:neprilysin-2-like n=1 Tax=Microplitis mediator TaxID=375433 RepID=UPI002555E0C9|nr:neprilysin-2-like [Microplitis mediator]
MILVRMGHYYKILRKVFVVASIGVIFSFFLTNTSAAVITEIHQNSEVTKNCPDKDCKELYLELTKKINTTLDMNINPCNNIQQFVCGHSRLESFSEKTNVNYDIMSKHLENLVTQSGDFADFRPFKLINDIYRTCMRYENAGQQSLDLLRDVIKKLGSWPLLEGDNWKESDFDWIDFSIKTQNIGLASFHFLDFTRFQNKHDGEPTVGLLLYVASGEFSRSAPSNTVIAAYKNYIAKVSELLGNTQTSKEEIDEMVAFECDISKLNNDQKFDNTEISFYELTKEFPSTNWQKFFENIRVCNNETPTNLSKLSVMKLPALSGFFELMEKTPKRVQVNYAVWRIIQETILYLTEEFRELQREYCLTQKCMIERRETSCLSVIGDYLDPALKLLFAKNFYKNGIDMIITEMAVNIKEQLVDLINESTWMDKGTKNQGIEILGNMSFVIGFKDKNNTDDEFLKYYENLEIDTNNYLQTLINLELFDQKFDTYTNLIKINSHNIVTSDHVYNDKGVLYVPMSMLQEPFFSVHYPMYVNYGYTGKAIADEIVKTIVSLGIDNLSSIDLRRVYHNKATCFEQRMKNYTSDNVGRPIEELFYAKKQISEHIAYKATYRAYQKWLTENGIEPSLPELPFSNNQLFWINSIRNSCNNFQKEPIVIDNKYSVFDFYKIRAVTNFREFHKDFNCPADGSFVENYGPACTF